MKRINSKSVSITLSNKEMKSIVGGKSKCDVCFWECNNGCINCTSSSADAASHGGHWECNTPTAIEHCGGVDGDAGDCG